LSLIQDRPQGSLAIINAIRILNNTANRRIPRAPSGENSRLFCRVVILMAIIVMGYLHGQQAVRLFVKRVADLRMWQVEKWQYQIDKGRTKAISYAQYKIHVGIQ
jgi:hypothetical protein